MSTNAPIAKAGKTEVGTGSLTVLLSVCGGLSADATASGVVGGAAFGPFGIGCEPAGAAVGSLAVGLGIALVSTSGWEAISPIALATGVTCDGSGAGIALSSDGAVGRVGSAGSEGSGGVAGLGKVGAAG